MEWDHKVRVVDHPAEGGVGPQGKGGGSSWGVLSCISSKIVEKPDPLREGLGWPCYKYHSEHCSLGSSDVGGLSRSRRTHGILTGRRGNGHTSVLQTKETKASQSSAEDWPSPP